MVPESLFCSTVQHIPPLFYPFHCPPVRRVKTYVGILASAVPFLLPNPLCLPIRLAAVSSRARLRECIVTGLRMMRPSAMSLRMVWRELALEISLTSFGSSQILRLPQSATEAASRFCVVRFTLCGGRGTC